MFEFHPHCYAMAELQWLQEDALKLQIIHRVASMHVNVHQQCQTVVLIGGSTSMIST